MENQPTTLLSFLNCKETPVTTSNTGVIVDLEFSVFSGDSYGVVEIWQVSLIDLLGRPVVEAFID